MRSARNHFRYTDEQWYFSSTLLLQYMRFSSHLQISAGRLWCRARCRWAYMEQTNCIFIATHRSRTGHYPDPRSPDHCRYIQYERLNLPTPACQRFTQIAMQMRKPSIDKNTRNVLVPMGLVLDGEKSDEITTCWFISVMRTLRRPGV